ncbi:unnamed protein product [Mytilus coruscus]|uniref:Uncharacterized protein n=1 Tax=Mytilus coruscus TaxID=42192 RepID=A0A6J8A5P0_MYTCO|nr:unnamed protein product [Mytilus coruscus]
MIVVHSFLNLLAYVEDGVIMDKLKEKHCTLHSPVYCTNAQMIKSRMVTLQVDMIWKIIPLIVQLEVHHVSKDTGGVDRGKTYTKGNSFTSEDRIGESGDDSYSSSGDIIERIITKNQDSADDRDHSDTKNKERVNDKYRSGAKNKNVPMKKSQWRKKKNIERADEKEQQRQID